MKFGKYFSRNTQNDMDDRPYIPYKTLKQLVKKMNHSSSHLQQQSTLFQSNLQQSLFSVEKYYRTKYQELSAELEGLITEFRNQSIPQAQKQIHAHCKHLCEELSSLKFYSVLNETAVQKITKKHDKKILSLCQSMSLLIQDSFISKVLYFLHIFLLFFNLPVMTD